MGAIDKITDNHTVLVKNLFKKETNVNVFIGKTVKIERFLGKVLGGFGQSGKVRVGFDEDLFEVNEAEEMKENEIREKLMKENVVLSYNKYVKIEKFLQS